MPIKNNTNWLLKLWEIKMFKKSLLIVISTICLYGGDLWEVGFQQGTSIFNIENSKKDKLSFECGERGGNIYLFNKGKEINLKANEPINFIINDEKKLLSVKEVSSSTVMTDTQAWGRLVYEIPKAKKISVESNNQNFTFEPSNLKDLNNFIQACTEYETSDIPSAPTQNTNKNSSSANTNTTASFNSNKQPFKLKFDSEYNQITALSYPILNITSLDNKLVINDIKINKGKCKIESQPDMKFDQYRYLKVIPKNFPISIAEFESQKFNISSGCNILRIDIETNNGTWIFGEN